MRATFAGKRVLVTGHTGFKGSWLCTWLAELGAEVFGYAKDPTSTPNVFTLAKVAADDVRGDVRDAAAVVKRVTEVKPDFVFHLAAQPLVRASYDDPVETFATNVLGTVHVLDAVRQLARPCVVVIVTTDKVYEDTGGVYAARETDPLGGSDPYSASKACAEIATSSYVRSFFGAGSPILVASARAGNVIGGGDFAVDRLVPDIVRAVQAKRPLELRHPNAVRPWQHVLEPLSGYLWLAARLAGSEGRAFAEGWNFGPSTEGVRTVREIAERATDVLGKSPIVVGEQDALRHEMASLTLTTDKARRRLGWTPVWTIDRAIEETMTWYRASFAGEDMHAYTLRQIADYVRDAGAASAPWA